MKKSKLRMLACTLASVLALTSAPMAAIADDGAAKVSENATASVENSGKTVSPDNIQVPFTDLEDGKYYVDAIKWAYANDVVAGTSDTTFSPDQKMSRAQIMAVLWRYYGRSQTVTSANPFADIEMYRNGKRVYYYDAVLWAVENGITSGTKPTKFSPYKSSTRAMAITFLYNVLGKPSYTTASPFLDVMDTAYYHDSALWAYENGVTNGLKKYTFGSQDTVTRGQFVTWLYKIVNNKNSVSGNYLYRDAVDTLSTYYNGTDYASAFDFGYYFSNKKSYARRFGDDPEEALAYFVNKGVNDGQQASASFDIKSYYNANQDLRIKYGHDYSALLSQYVTSGCYENRTTVDVKSIIDPVTAYEGKDYSSIYDFAYYVTHNSDAAVYAEDDIGAIKHFVTTGLKNYKQAKEGVPTTSLDYLKLHNDLYPATVSDDPHVNKANEYNSKTEYLILMNKSEHHVYIFKGAQGYWTRIKDFACGDGASSTPTPIGVFEIGDRLYYFDSGSVRCFYATRIHGSIMFHSTLYSQTSTPKYEVDGRVGLALSHGCVRCKLQNAKWIYDNIPAGTTCVVYK